MMVRHLLAAVGIVLAFATSVLAQPTYNPTRIIFDSPDHNIVCPAEMCVSAYTVEFWLLGVDPATGQPVQTSTLPKTAVTANPTPPGTYQALLTALTPLFSIPIGNSYVARMIAVGSAPAIVSPRSDPSGPFERAVAPRGVINLSIR